MTARRPAFFGNYTITNLPNTGQVVDLGLKVGDFAYDTSRGVIVVCKDATDPTAVWVPVNTHYLIMGMVGALPSNVTRYFHPAGGGLMTTELGFRVDQPFVARKLDLQANTGPGVLVDTVQVRKNGGGSALEANLTGAEVTKTKSDAPLSFAVDDIFSVRIITAVATATTDLIVTVTVDGP